MKIYLEPIEVETRDGLPYRLRWRRQTHTVREVADSWTYTGRWWATEIHREYFRLVTDRGVVEVFRSNGEWRLSRVLD